MSKDSYPNNSSFPTAESKGEEAVEYLRRSFTAVDGLWFVKVEEAFGFEQAMDLDRDVWEVTGKIQARTARRLAAEGAAGLEGLAKSLRLKFSAEGYGVTMEEFDSGALTVRIENCPWLEILQRAERMHMAETIAKKICTADFGAWAREFGVELDFDPQQTLCCGRQSCAIRFVEEQE